MTLKITDKTPKVYLSRRNLLALLSKLDRQAAGEETYCTIIKNKQPGKTEYNQTMERILVIAVEDREYYDSQQRPAGEMHPLDEAKLNKPTKGVLYNVADL